MKLMLVDGNSVMHACQDGTKLTVGGREVQAVFGFLRTMKKLAQAHRDATPIVLWDGRAQWRFDLWPQYKGNRESTPEAVAAKEAVRDQRPEIQYLLRTMGVRQMANAGAEADDLAAKLTRKAVEKGNEVVLITGDKDWIQMIDKGVMWIDHRRDRAVTPANFSEFTGLANPRQFVEAKALTGDTSDNIPGVGGIGEKGVAELLMRFGTVDNLFHQYASGTGLGKIPKAWFDLCANNAPKASTKWGEMAGAKDAYERNLKLMDLGQSPALDSRKHFDLTTFSIEKDPATLFRERCEELNFNSVLRELGAWTRLFPFGAG